MKPERILVDTSAWIVSFKKGGDNNAKSYLTQNIAAGLVVTTPLVILELIQGCKTEKERDDLRVRLESLDSIHLTDRVWQRAYNLAFVMRRKGITIPAVDILITALVLENDCTLLHFDRHFIMIRDQIKQLKLKSMGSL